MRYLTSAVRVWIDEDRELRASAELALPPREPQRFAEDSAALLAMLQHGHCVLHVRNPNEALLVKR